MYKIRKIIAALLLMLMSGLIITGCGTNNANVPEHVFVYAENQPEDYPATKAAYRFAELVKEKSDGRIEILVKSDGKMGDEEDVLTQMDFGGVDFTRVSLSSLSDDIPELSVLMMPYLYSSETAMWEVLDGDIGQHFFDAVNDNALPVRALSWYDAGARNFYSVKLIDSLDDLAGLNIRVQESDVMSDLIKTLGANPIQMAYSEVNQGLRTRKIDGAENNWSSFEYSGQFESARYCIVDEHTRIPEIQLISELAWDKLSDTDKEIINECALESAKYERDLWSESEDDSKAKLENYGVKIVDVNESEIDKFQSGINMLYDKYCADYMDLVQQIRGIQ